VITASCQEKNNEHTISNSENYNYSPFVNYNINGDKADFVCEIEIASINYAKYYNENDSNVTGIDTSKLNTALEIRTEENGLIKIYYYPVDINFNNNWITSSNTESKKRIQVYFELFKSEKQPVALINKVELMD
jgi:hypothetical protein